MNSLPGNPFQPDDAGHASSKHLIQKCLPPLCAIAGDGPRRAVSFNAEPIRSGNASSQDYERWADYQRQAMASNVFFCACNYYAVIARRG